MTIEGAADIDALQAQIDCDRATLELRQKELAAEKSRRLQDQHQTLFEQCRAAKLRSAELSKKAEAAKLESMKADGALKNSIYQLQRHREDQPRPYNYPAPEEVAAWEQKRDDLKARNVEAEKICSDKSAAYRCLCVERNTARRTFEALAEKESELRAQLYPQQREPLITVFDGITEGPIAWRGR